MPNPTFTKEDSAAGTLDLETPLHTHFTHYGGMDYRINYNLTPLNRSLKLTLLLCIRYYRHANVVAYKGL